MQSLVVGGAIGYPHAVLSVSAANLLCAAEQGVTQKQKNTTRLNFDSLIVMPVQRYAYCHDWATIPGCLVLTSPVCGRRVRVGLGCLATYCCSRCARHHFILWLQLRLAEQYVVLNHTPFSNSQDMIKRSGTLPSAIKALTDAMTRVNDILEGINKRIPDKSEQQRMMVVRGLVESVNGPEALVRP